MEPMTNAEAWWPDYLGLPSASGSQNALRYAFFRDAHRLVIEEGGRISIYDSGKHIITAVSCPQGQDEHVSLSTEQGPLALRHLTMLESTQRAW